MRPLIRFTLSLAAITAGPVSAQIIIQNGSDIVMTGSAGSQVVFPDGTVQSTAAGSDPVPGHGGLDNTVSGNYAFVGGGRSNTASGNFSAISGGRNNQAAASFATIAGGGYTTVDLANRVTDRWGTVGGGRNNQAGDNAGTTDDSEFTTIGGGINNAATEVNATVSGGRSNTASGYSSVVSGGQENSAGGYWAWVGGGSNNTASGDLASAVGGAINTASANRSTVGGGGQNTASGGLSTVSGGYTNTAGGEQSTVIGGAANTASALYSTVLGGVNNVAAGDYSVAVGRQAKIAAAHDGSFVFADAIGVVGSDFNSAAANEFAVRATGGVRFITNSGLTSGAVLTAGDSSWGTPSSKALKENKRAIDSVAILEKLASIPVEEWNYIHQDDSIRHIGPYAEDFHAAFGLSGEFDGRITTQDFDGVELAAIQGLNQKLEEKEAIIAAQTQSIADLKARLDALEARFDAIKSGPG